MKRLISYGALSLTLLVVSACASSKGTSQAGSQVHRSSNAVTAEELASTGAVNVYDALQRLRPQWLTSSRIRRGGSGDDLVVYLDSNRYGTMGSLRQLSLGGVQEVRYYGASEATNRYGTGHTGGAILVMMSK